MAREEWESRSSPWKKAGTAVAIILVAILLLAVLFIVTSSVFGWRTETVLSGSMEPAILTGSVVVARPIAPGDVRAGDVIMFGSPAVNILTTHRVVGVESKADGPHFTTKGDANKDQDMSTVAPNQLVGTIVLTIPYLGYLISFIRTPPGLFLFIGLPVTILIIGELLNLYRSLD